MKHLDILNSTLDGLIVIQDDGIIRFCNHAANAMLGYSENELVDLPVEILLPEAFRHAHVAQRSSYMLKPKKRIMNQKNRLTAIRKDNSEFSVAISLNPIEIDGDAYVCALIQDLTQVEAEAVKLEQSQKLEALGGMVSGIAHNFNNIVAGVLGQTYLLDKQELLTVKGDERVKSINSLCNHAANIIKQLLVYARHQGTEFDNFELSQTTNEVINIARLTAPRKIDIQFKKAKNDLIVHGMKTQIQQTLFNLINNAIHAIGDSKGSINISTENCSGHKCDLKQCSLNRNDAGAFICIKVCDTGKGISESDMHRIFDPFFSTKATGQGTGLGLSTSYGIIKKHGGEISASNTNDGGALLQFFLPINEEETTRKKEPAITDPATAEQKGTFILIMDDDTSISSTLAEILKEFGYSTFTALDGKEGVEIFKQHQDKIKLVISDVTMPKLNGQEAMTAIRDLNPEIPFLFITGHQDNSVDASILCDRTQVMLKPFDFSKLSHKVKELLN